MVDFEVGMVMDTKMLNSFGRKRFSESLELSLFMSLTTNSVFKVDFLSETINIYRKEHVQTHP